MSMDNASFQSLLQLAVALNVGFAAVATFMGNTLSKEKEKIELLFETSKAIRDISKEKNEGILSEKEIMGFREVTDLRKDITKAEIRHDFFFGVVVKWVALIFAVVAFAFLVAASWDADSYSNVVAWAAILANVPLLVLIILASVYSMWSISPLRRKRYNLDLRMSEKLVDLTRLET